MKNTKKIAFILFCLLQINGILMAQKASNDIPQPSAAAKEFLKLQYGLFLHIGPNTREGVSWGNGHYPVDSVYFPKLDMAQWAKIAKECGMKYAVLTAKHHDGYCMWPFYKYTDYSSKNSPGSIDYVKMFVEEFRKQGLKVGIYYSLWDRNHTLYSKDSIYAEYMKNQLTELLTNYGDVVELWFDGAWDKDNPKNAGNYYIADWDFNPKKYGMGQGEKWHWDEIYALVKKLQPNCLVSNNSGIERGGRIRYTPVDVRNIEQLDYEINNQRIPWHKDSIFVNKEGKKVYVPLEVCTSLTPGWFNLGKTYPDYCYGSDAIINWYTRARKVNGNFLLNVGPDKTGRIRELDEFYLREASKELKLGIYKK